MDIVGRYRQEYRDKVALASDFLLTLYKEGILFGVDNHGLTAVIAVSSTPKELPVKQCTNKLSIECNVRVSYEENGRGRCDVVHVIRCLMTDEESRELFLHLAKIMVEQGDLSADSLLHTYQILADFFTPRPARSDEELRGLYGELFTIRELLGQVELGKYWHSIWDQKYDFSISSTMKLEVKTTVKPQRIHRFDHGQLVSESFKIFVLSYQLQSDDQGLSLFELLVSCKQLVSSDLRKVMQIEKVLRDEQTERLKQLSFNAEYVSTHLRIIPASNLPHLERQFVAGVSNIKYDVDCSFAAGISREELITAIHEELATF